MSYRQVVIHIAVFFNNTPFPVMVEGTIEIMPGLNKLDSILVEPGETCNIKSITGEWFVNTYFKEIKYRVPWARNKLNNMYEIGKFRNEPCIYGDYSWMETDKFTITREEDNVFRFDAC
jgi:hypothetical protein